MTQLIGNRFRVLSELGQGSMGAVYRVADTLADDQEMALKRIQVTGTITPELRLRFKEEFRAMTRLKHPNTIAVYDYGQLDASTQYLTMELVPGAELAEMLVGAYLPYDQVYGLLIQLLQALGFIHSRLYVHRDIKSQNIRVTPEGTLKLMDFGLMGQLGVSARGTAVTGTPGYLPPEAVQGGVIDASSDLYSVGCLAYEMVTGRLPFEGRLIEVVRAHVTETPKPMAAWRADVPPALEAIVSKLMAKDQTARYQQAAEVIADLSRLAGLAVARENLEQKKSYLVSAAMVGRDDELAELQRMLDEAIAGRGRGVYLGAPAGVGKSRLTAELLLHAKLKDAIVLYGRCLEVGQQPVDPIVDAFRPLLALTTAEERTQIRPLLSRLFPEADEAENCSMPDESEFASLLEQMTVWIDRTSARTPLVLAIDDLHWASGTTLEILNALIPRLEGKPVLVLGTLRSDETPVGSPVWYTVNEGFVRFMRLAPFNCDQVGQLIDAMLRRVDKTQGFCDFMSAKTGGNAFFVTEVIRYLMEEGQLTLRDGVWQVPQDLEALAVPSTVEATVLRRLAQLSPCARHVAATAAVLGRVPDLETLVTVSTVEEESLFCALDELVEGQFLVRDDHQVVFPHDRVREAMYDQLAAEERRALHQRYAEHLERVHAEAPTAVLAELAHHYHRGEDHAKAYTYLHQLADGAHQAGSFPLAVQSWGEAIGHLEAIDYPDKHELIATLQSNIGVFGFNLVPREAIEALEKALPYYESKMAENPQEYGKRMVQVMAALGGSYGFHGRPDKSAAMAERLSTIIRADGSPVEGALKAIYCTSYFPAGRFDELVATAKVAAGFLIDKDLSGYLPLVYSTRVGSASYQNARSYQGYRPSRELMEYAIWACHEIKAYNLTNVVRHFPALWYAWTGREDEAIALMNEMAEVSRQIGAPPSPYLLYLRPFILWQRGELDDALVLVRQALRYPHLEQSIMTLQMIRVLKGMIELGMGELEAAEATVAPVEAEARENGLLFVRMQAHLMLGKVALAKGERERAHGLLLDVEAMASGGPARNPLLQAIALQYLAESDLQVRDFAQAKRRLEAAMAIACDPEQDNLILQAHLHVSYGALHQAQGDLEAARQAWLTAADGYHQLKNKHMVHLIQLRLEGLSGTATARVPEMAPVEQAREVARVPSWMRDSGAAMRGW